MSSFTSDERAFLEPNNDIMTTALVVAGFVIFASILSNTYFAFSDNSRALESYEQAAMIAGDIASYPPLQGSRPGIICAKALDNIANPVIEPQEHYLFFHRFSPDMEFYVEASTDDGSHQWIIEQSSFSREGRDIIAASVPVVIELGSNARCVTGTITVKIMYKRWK
ncbi:hypothetical protein [Methanolobus sp. WCC5]|jgi:hypothetical protein|uniref:hypothetical protein n=1 Tax=Methanolobus sp. WCC5 TaxID=3125785 RepID=UPI00324BD5FD